MSARRKPHADRQRQIFALVGGGAVVSPSCAYCGNPATERDYLDGRHVAACKRCLSPVPDPLAGTAPHRLAYATPTPPRLLAIIADIGGTASTRQIGDALGIGTMGTDATRYRGLCAAIDALVAAGTLESERVTPHKTRAGLVYRVRRERAA